MSAYAISVSKAAVLAVTFAVGAFGCSSGSAVEDDSAAVETKGPGLVFEANKEYATGDLSVGSAVSVTYDASRLTKCRGDQYGKPGWTITGHYSIEGGDVKDFYVAGFSSDGSKVVPKLQLDAPGDLEVWFENTSVFGCQAFDSDFGKNYHFTVKGTKAAASISFAKTGDPKVAGALKAPGTVAITYDVDRLTTCRGSQGGYDQWRITGFASLNGAKATTFVVGGGGATGTANVDVNSEGTLAVWFENTSTYGCHAYDSNNSANYTFTVGR